MGWQPKVSLDIAPDNVPWGWGAGSKIRLVENHRIKEQLLILHSELTPATSLSTAQKEKC